MNEKQERFCREYVIDLNATQAAIRAGYSEKTAYSQGDRLLKNVEAQSFIQKLQQGIATRLEVSADRVVQEWAAIGYSNMKDFITDGNEIVDISTLDREKTKLIESVKTTVTEFEGGTKKSVQIKLHSKTAALEALSKHTGIFEKDNNQKQVIIQAPVIQTYAPAKSEPLPGSE